MVEEWRFDTEEVFEDDYLYFYADVLSDEVNDRQADTVWELLRLEPGAAVLDLACGHGRIANRLAQRGAAVTGLDATELFLDRAREDATARGVEVDYLHGDMRDLPWTQRFDAVACVFTAFGYFCDDDNRRVLDEVRRVLRPDGRFWVDLVHLPWLLANFRAEVVAERDGDWMIDRNRYDPPTGRILSERSIIRDGRQRTFRFFLRAFTFTELRDWLLAAGFSRVDACDARGEALTADSPRMVVVASA
jgi:ubiquinone/menaquinone biosynthesis C-methylase UbiE